MYLIIKENGEVVTNTNNADEIEHYPGTAVITFEAAGISDLTDLPAHPAFCIFNFETGVFTVNEEKKAAAEAARIDRITRLARIEELYAATNSVDEGLTPADRMFRIGRLKRGLSEV